MITEGMIKRNDCKDLLEIKLIHNVNGCNTEAITIGYMKEDIMAVLAEWLTRFYIVECDGIEIYPMSYVGYPYALSINKAVYFGDSHVYDIDDFEDVYEAGLNLVATGRNDKYDRDYMDRLGIGMKYEIIKDAVEYNKLFDYIDIYTRTMNWEKFNDIEKDILSKVNDHKITIGVFNRASLKISKYLEGNTRKEDE